MGINLFCHQIRDPKGIVKPPPYTPNTHPLITSQSAALVLSLPSSWLRNRFRAKELWKFNLSNTYVHILDIASSRTIFDQRWRVTNLRDRQRRYRKVKGNGRPNAKPITIYLRPPPIHRIDKACEAIGAFTETNRVSNTLLLTPVSLPPSLSCAHYIWCGAASSVVLPSLWRPLAQTRIDIIPQFFHESGRWLAGWLRVVSRPLCNVCAVAPHHHQPLHNVKDGTLAVLGT